MKTLVRYSGRVLTILGIVHVLCAPLFYADALRGIVSAGIFNGVGDLPDRDAAFWFIGFGLLVIVLGEIVHWTQRQTGVVPPFLGPGLLVISIVAVIVTPASPFWLILALAMVEIAAARQPAHQLS